MGVCGSLWEVGQKGEAEPASISPVGSKPQESSWQEKGEMSARGRRQETIAPGFPSTSLAASFSHPLNIGFPWILFISSPLHTVLTRLEIAHSLSQLRCHPSAEKHSKSILSQVFLLSSRLTHPTTNLTPSVRCPVGTKSQQI